MRSGGCCSARWNNKERMGPESGPVEPAKGVGGWVGGVNGMEMEALNSISLCRVFR